MTIGIDSDDVPPLKGSAELARYSEDENVLAKIGAALQDVGRMIHVNIPTPLARKAIDAWHREETDAIASEESHQERTTRHRAGSLALIGAALHEHGGAEGDHVSVAVDAWLLGHALDAADECNLITAGQTSTTKEIYPRFVNVDLDLISKGPMEALANALHEAGCILYDGPEGDLHRLIFELSSNPTTVNDTCLQMMDLLNKLPNHERELLDNCESRILDIGIDNTGSEPIVQVSAELVTRAAKLRCGIFITCYPGVDDTNGPFYFRHHVIK